MASSGAKPTSSMRSRSLPGEGVDDFADGVGGQSAVELFDEVGGGAVFDFQAGGAGGVPTAIRVCGQSNRMICRMASPSASWSMAELISSRRIRAEINSSMGSFPWRHMSA